MASSIFGTTSCYQIACRGYPPIPQKRLKKGSLFAYFSVIFFCFLLLKVVTFKSKKNSEKANAFRYQKYAKFLAIFLFEI